MTIAIGIVVGLIMGGVIGIFLSTFSKERKLAAQLERSTKALKEAEILQQQQAQEIKQLRQSPSQMQGIEESYQIKIQEIEQSYKEQSEELSQTKTKLSKLEQNERKIQKIQQTYQTQLEILEQTYQARLKETLQQVQRFAPVLETNQAQIQQIEQIYQTQLQEQQQAHQQAINELEKAYDEGDFSLDEWRDLETSDTLNSGSLLEAKLPDFLNINSDNLSEDLVHDTTEALSLEQTEGRTQNRVADLFQQKKSDDLDFLEMLPTDEETTKDLSGAFTKDSKKPTYGFFESETKETTRDPDEIFSSFLDTEKSEENLTNRLQIDDKNKS
jgi:DNA repair exonuclease SbcCD ATPase subunit